MAAAVRAAAEPRTRIRRVPRSAFTPALLADLHRLSDRLMREEFEHFAAHARTNDIVHVFERADTDETVGFQFWRTAPIDLPRARVVIGGKLRILPEFRGRALHLRSGLRFLVEQKLRHPCARHYRLSLASVFGFAAIAPALAEYRFYEPDPGDRETRAVSLAFERLAGDSHYAVDRASGLFDVRIFITEETLARYRPSFFDKPAVRAYATVNPDYRTNGRYAGFWFRFTPGNLAAIVRAIRHAGSAGARLDR